MLLRLSRLSSCLAVAAGALALLGPAEWRGLGTDIALACAAVGFMLWRAALVLRARLERAVDAVPAALPLDAIALGEAAGLVARAAAQAATFEAALHQVADCLRSELGARAARVFAVSERDGVAGVRELIAAQPGFFAPRRELGREASTLGRALREQRPCLDLPGAVALLELVDIPLAFEDGALAPLLGAAVDRLAARGDGLPAEPAARSDDSAAGPAARVVGAAAPGRLAAAFAPEAGACAC
jgi:hypothetical protein